MHCRKVITDSTHSTQRVKSAVKSFDKITNARLKLWSYRILCPSLHDHRLTDQGRLTTMAIKPDRPDEMRFESIDAVGYEKNNTIQSCRQASQGCRPIREGLSDDRAVTRTRTAERVIDSSPCVDPRYSVSATARAAPGLDRSALNPISVFPSFHLSVYINVGLVNRVARSLSTTAVTRNYG